MTLLNVPISDLVKKKVLTKAEAEKYDGLKIPYHGGADLWDFKHRMDEKIRKAIDSGKVQVVEQGHIIPVKAPHIISDDLGMQGVHNPADGNKYDSKSAYYKAVDKAGCYINEQRPDDFKAKEFKSSGIKEDIAEAYKQTVGV